MKLPTILPHSRPEVAGRREASRRDLRHPPRIDWVVEGTRMRAAVIEGYGGVDRLQVREMGDPSPGPGQLLVRVMAAGLNPLDAQVRRGPMRFIQPVKFP